ncbi:60S ribosomal protein L18a-like [Mustela putorius furo]|uniref:60S ribosomal protein L18a-like n=1 Tax=Mustela putorius furo TaxID=9669 RepID=A0A8U0TDT7_MUSPF|nr:60S ribosomal protein L18a-like [Mustela putorius furo]
MGDCESRERAAKAMGTLPHCDSTPRWCGAFPIPPNAAPPLYTPHANLFIESCCHQVPLQKKMKKSLGEIVYCDQRFEKFPLWLKNLGTCLRYDCPCRTHNRYKEYPDRPLWALSPQVYVPEQTATSRRSFCDFSLTHLSKLHSIECYQKQN